MKRLKIPEEVLYREQINESLPPPEGFRGDRDPENEELDVVFDDHGTETLIITFGSSGRLENGETRYGFAGYLTDHQLSNLRVKDHYQIWYLNGIRGLSTNVKTTVVALDKKIKNINPKYTIAAGVSFGGYAALLFGRLLGVDRVVAIGPQTYLRLGVKSFVHHKLYKLKWCDKEEFVYHDLLNLEIPQGTRVDIVYGKDDVVDRFHSGRMAALGQVTLHPVDGDHYSVAINLRDDGKLEKYLRYEEKD